MSDTRYAVWSKNKDINLFADRRTFKDLSYAKRLCLNAIDYTGDDSLFVKPIPVDSLEDKIKALESQNEKLVEVLSKAKEGLIYYSDSDDVESYEILDWERVNNPHCIQDRGKRARQTLKELGVDI